MVINLVLGEWMGEWMHWILFNSRLPLKVIIHASNHVRTQYYYDSWTYCTGTTTNIPTLDVYELRVNEWMAICFRWSWKSCELENTDLFVRVSKSQPIYVERKSKLVCTAVKPFMNHKDSMTVFSQKCNGHLNSSSVWNVSGFTSQICCCKWFSFVRMP